MPSLPSYYLVKNFIISSIERIIPREEPMHYHICTVHVRMVHSISHISQCVMLAIGMIIILVKP